ncbi:unnamed protein product [Mucor hiemalis]
MPAIDKRAPQQDEGATIGDIFTTPVGSTSIASLPSSPVDGDTVTPTTATASITRSVSRAQTTPTTTGSLSSGLFTVLTQMTLAPSPSSLPPSLSASGTVITPIPSSSVRPITPSSDSMINTVPNGLLMFTFVAILFVRFFKH